MTDADLMHPDLLNHDLLNLTREEFLAPVPSTPPTRGLVEELWEDGFSPDEALEIIEFYTLPLQSTPE